MSITINNRSLNKRGNCKWPMSWSARGTIFGMFFVNLRQEGEHAFSKNSGQDKNVMDHSTYCLFEFSELTILKIPPGGRQSSGLVCISWSVTGYILRASMPYSRPYINTYENLLPNVPPSDQLSLPLINYPNIPITDKPSLTMIICPFHCSAVPPIDQEFLALIYST